MVGSGEASAFLTPLVWLVVALLIAIPALAIVRATVLDGTLDWSVGIGLILGLMLGAGLVLKSGGAGWAVCFGVALIGACGAFPFLGRYFDRATLKKLRSDDLERLEQAVQFDPANAGAHAGLAEKWAEIGRLNEAVDEYRIAIRLMPDGPASKRWKTQLRTTIDRQNGFDRYDCAVCRDCGEEMPKNSKDCPHCGEVQRMNFFEWSSKGENLLPALREGGAIVAALFLVLLLLRVLPPALSAILALSLLVVGGWLLWQKTQI